MVTPAAKRDAVAHLCRSWEVSERRACVSSVLQFSAKVGVENSRVGLTGR